MCSAVFACCTGVAAVSLSEAASRPIACSGWRKSWLAAAKKQYPPSLNKLYAESLYEIGWMEKPVGESNGDGAPEGGRCIAAVSARQLAGVSRGPIAAGPLTRASPVTKK